MKINIIGDIAGRFDELMILLDKMPEADLILSVGDMVDRGQKSPQVLKWFMETPNAEAVYGNHEDLFYNAVLTGKEDYNNWCMWIQNGGYETAESFRDPETGEILVDSEIMEWLSKRPMYFQTDDLFVSHAPVTSLKHIPEDPHGRDHFFIWNRCAPSKPQDKFMIYGHNGQFRIHKWGDGSEFAMCVDNSHRGKLTGVHWPTREVFEVDYLPRDESLEERAENEMRPLFEEEKRAIEIMQKYKDY